MYITWNLHAISYLFVIQASHCDKIDKILRDGLTTEIKNHIYDIEFTDYSSSFVMYASISLTK